MKTITEIAFRKEQEISFNIASLNSLLENSEEEGTHNNDQFRIFWIQNGSGTFNIDLRTYSFEKNQVFFAKPGQACLLNTNSQDEGYVISFTESFLNTGDPEFDSAHHTSLFQMFTTAQGIAVSPDVIADMGNIVYYMTREHNSANLFKTEVLKRYLKIYLIYLTRQFEGSFYVARQTRNVELVQRFMTLLEKNFKSQKMVAFYANTLRITPNYLNEIIKKTTGNSASHHIRQRIVLEAKRKAAYSDSCMKEIAYNLGFCDIAHFSKFFKSIAGMSFTDFRKEQFIFSVTPAA